MSEGYVWGDVSVNRHVCYRGTESLAATPEQSVSEPVRLKTDSELVAEAFRLPKNTPFIRAPIRNTDVEVATDASHNAKQRTAVEDTSKESAEMRRHRVFTMKQILSMSEMLDDNQETVLASLDDFLNDKVTVQGLHDFDRNLSKFSDWSWDNRPYSSHSTELICRGVINAVIDTVLDSET